MRHLRPLCSHCIYWLPDSSGTAATVGHCHRFPPGIYVNPQTGTVVQKFPTTDHHHWCGEWNGDDSKLTEAVRQTALQSAK
jgi:hypothetical protein